MNMRKIKRGPYRVIRFFVKLFYPKITVEGLENLPREPCVAVGNHSKMHGPIAAELYFPGDHYIWCAGQMMNPKEVPAYAFQDFWGYKPKCVQPIYRLLSYINAPFSVCIFNEAHTIAVHHDGRILSTFRDTLKRLKEGNHVVIYPEHDQPHNHILQDFQEGFVDVSRSYYKQTGKSCNLCPCIWPPG